MVGYIDVFKLNYKGAKMKLSNVNEYNQMSAIAAKEYNSYMFNNRSIALLGMYTFHRIAAGCTAYGYSDHGAFCKCKWAA